MQRSCAECGKDFEITDVDLAFYDKVSPVFNGKKESIPPPTRCPDCRQQRRMACRNQIYVYTRPSSTTGKPMFSMLNADAPFPVIDNAEWYGDGWDPLSFGQEYDFSRPFFEQYEELRSKVPHPSRAIIGEMPNSDYSNNATDLKNCYLVFNASYAQDCIRCETLMYGKDCMECTYVRHDELCYDCTDCHHCYNVQSSVSSSNCSDSFFLHGCIGCRNCFGCVNLRQKEYCVWNEQKTKEEYEAFLRTIELGSYAARRTIVEEFHAFAMRFPQPHVRMINTERSTGNYITNSENVEDSFFIEDGQALRHCFCLEGKCRDSMDHTLWGDRSELVYESAMCGSGAFNMQFCNNTYNDNHDQLYCSYTKNCSRCFGCVGLRNAEYCILNKHYTKEEYEKLVPKIIEHMRTTHEWGEFFPLQMSPYSYNHSLAQRYYPLSKEETERKGLTWYQEELPEASQAIDADALPDGLPPGDDPIIVRSALSGRPFKITGQEIKRCRQFNVPLPRLTYDEQLHERSRALGGITLYDRTCAKTGKPIKTTIPPDSPWIVWDRDEWVKEFGG